MEYAYSDEEGEFLVKIARQSLTYYLENRKKLPIPDEVPEKLTEKSGVFVTLNIFDKSRKHSELRGCIGRPLPEYPLIEATIDSAVDAGVGDPRFDRVTKSELADIQFEVTALTPPELIEAETIEDLFNAIEIGRDGLLIRASRKYFGGAGLFLPQVPIEWHWNKEEYLTELCGKAGISHNAWKDLKEVKIFKFMGEIFEEDGPNKPIKRQILTNTSDGESDN
jgi:hypothetical protein